MLYPHNFVPAFLTKERLKLAWEQVSQLRGLLPQAYCQPHKVDRHAFDSHPMQHGVALFHYAFKMALQCESLSLSLSLSLPLSLPLRVQDGVTM